MSFEIEYYRDYLSEPIADLLLEQSTPVDGVEGLRIVGTPGGLENQSSLNFVVRLYNEVKDNLKDVLDNRIQDRNFIDQKTKECRAENENSAIDFLSPDYKTILWEKDSNGRTVIGPLNDCYTEKGSGKDVAPIPSYLCGYHVTLFGPPDSEKMCINAMNTFHRKLPNEPEIVSELLNDIDYTPKWGADSEDSKTPLRSDLLDTGVNLTKCMDHDFEFTDPKGKHYKLEDSNLSHAIKRFPGLALPSYFLFVSGSPIPLHIYDLALHVYRNWQNPEALVFYVPKLENEEEARYIAHLMGTTERLIKEEFPEYRLGTIRLMIVLENPRAVFRTNEIIDELYPYFVGASLGWHDYLGSTARLFKEDPNYRIPVKADPDIVIKYIKASHDLLADVVGARGGIKVGGMYGILPTDTDRFSNSFQVTIRGYIRDVITQLKRDLTGFWVAHPDFVRLGMAFVEAWKIYQKGNFEPLEKLVTELLDTKYHREILEFIKGDDIEGLDKGDPLYPRSLIVADLKESDFIANNHPDEVRYNVFQSLQYITDWLSGNGCVALPTTIGGQAVRIMDDLATAERSRWEVWHEIYHGRFDLYEFLKIAHEELNFIRKDLSDQQKIVQVKWTEANDKWYPVAFNLMIKLMTDTEPAEFATELLLPFAIDSVREADDPWGYIKTIDPKKYRNHRDIERFNYLFRLCGELEFAKSSTTELKQIEKVIMGFGKRQIIEAASFHGNIGENKKTLDAMATTEQQKVLESEQGLLLEKGKEYLKKFGFKFLVSAKGKTGAELLEILEKRSVNTEETELQNARRALFEITKKRLLEHPPPWNN